MKFYMKRLLMLWTLILSVTVMVQGQTVGTVWKCNYFQYESDHMVYITLTEKGQPITDSHVDYFEVGAFAASENNDIDCRGLASKYYNVQGQKVYMLRVWSHTEEANGKFVLKAYSRKTGYVYDLKTTDPLSFAHDFIGSIQNPVTADIADFSVDEDVNYPEVHGTIWRCLYGKYEKDIPGVYQVQIPDSLSHLSSIRCELGAFLPTSDGPAMTCRGVRVSPDGQTPDGGLLYILRVWTNDDMKGVVFRLYDSENMCIYELAPRNPIDVTAAAQGSAKEPVVLQIVDNKPEPPVEVKYSATFCDDAKNVISSEAFTSGTTLTPPEPPVKEGHHFTGWQPALPEVMPARNMTFRATYAPNVYVVTFVGDGGTVLATYELPYGSTISEVPDARVASKTFTGWDDATFRKGETIVRGDVTYTACYRVDVLPLTFVIDGEEYMSTGLAYGESIVLPTPQKEGYTFQGWDGLPADGLMPAEPLTLTGHFAPNRHTLSFLLADGTVLSSTQVDYGALIEVPKVDVTGYTFIGWEEAIPATMPDSDVVCKAKPLKAIDYHVRYMIYENEEDEMTLFRDIILHYGDRMTAEDILPNLVVEGYDCTPWDWAGFDAATMTMPAEDIVVTSRRTIRRHNVSFMNGEDVVSTQTCDYGTAIARPDSPEKVGYTFVGWMPDVDQAMPDHDVTYVAQYVINEYFVNFIDYNGRVISSTKFPYGTPITVTDEAETAVSSREGYDFTGWLVGNNTTPALTISATVPAMNVNITATYKEHMYTVSFVDADGNVIVTYKMSYGSVINSNPVAPEKHGMSFAGWEPEFIPGYTAVSADQVFTAAYKANPHALVYEIDGETFYTQWLVAGEQIIAPQVPQRTGYTFSGWNGLPQMMPDSAVTITGSYVVNHHDVTFFVEGSVPQTFTYAYGAPIESPFPVREGYTFKGWNTVVEQTMPDYDLEYTAVFAKNQYTVTFYNAPQSGGDITTAPILNRQILTMGDVVARPADPVRKGYTFVGWSPDFVEGTQVTTHDVTYVANYTPCVYKLTYMLDGEVYAVREYVYGRQLMCLPDVIEKGKTFSGWSYTPEAAFAAEAHTFPAVMPDHDVTIVGYLYEKTDVFSTDEGILYAVKDDAEDAAELLGFDDAGVEMSSNGRGQRVARRAASGETLVLPAKVTREDGKEFTLTSIAPGAFQNADITAITIPATVTTIGEGALNSESLASICFEGEVVPELKAGAFDTEQVSIIADAVADDVLEQVVSDLKASNDALVLQTEMANEDDKKLTEQTFRISGSVIGLSDVSVEGGGQHRYGETVMLFVPAVEGYSVSYKVNDGDDVWSNFYITTADQNVEVQFAYSPKAYNVIYTIDGETICTVPTVYGTAISTENVSVSERRGYTFAGWNTVPVSMPAHDVTVIGAYKVNEYTFTVIIDDVETVHQQLPYGTSLIIPIISKEGYCLQWDNELPETMPDSNFTLYGHLISEELVGIADTLHNGGNGAVYNLQGQRISTLRVKKGIFIVDGKRRLAL